MKIAQIRESTKDFKFLARNPGTVRLSSPKPVRVRARPSSRRGGRNSKAKVILRR